jgi:hypothetical protein
MLLGNEFGHFMSFNIGQLQTLSDFREMFSAQLETLQNIEEVDRLDKELETQVIFYLFLSIETFLARCINMTRSMPNGERQTTNCHLEHTI